MCASQNPFIGVITPAPTLISAVLAKPLPMFGGAISNGTARQIQLSMKVIF